MVCGSSNWILLTQSFQKLKYICSGEKVPNFWCQHSICYTWQLGHVYSLKGLYCCRVTPDVTARWPRVPVSDNCGGFDICSCLPESECVKTVPARNQTKPSHSKVGSNQGPRILYNVSYNCGLTCDEICSILISVGLRSNILGLVRRYFSCWIVVENRLEITFQVWLWWCWYYGLY